jgi:hypothetical protein
MDILLLMDGHSLGGHKSQLSSTRVSSSCWTLGKCSSLDVVEAIISPCDYEYNRCICNNASLNGDIVVGQVSLL